MTTLSKNQAYYEKAVKKYKKYFKEMRKWV